MRFVSSGIVASMALFALAAPVFAFPHSHRAPTSPRALRTRTASKAAVKTSSVSHVGIGTERATQIQSALIKQGYLTGEPTGTWDKESQAAMEKMQSDNGWQTKLVPDSRAIIKLGLGPTASSPVGDAEGFESAGHVSEGSSITPANQ